MHAELLIGNDQLLKVTGVQDAVSLDYINTATVTATLKTLQGVAVSGETWPITLDYIVDSDGDYQGILEDGIELVDRRRYILEVSIDAGADLIAFYRLTVTARYRTAETC